MAAIYSSSSQGVVRFHFALAPLARGESPCSHSYHLSDTRLGLIGSNHRGSFSFPNEILCLCQSCLCWCFPQHLLFRKHAESAGPVTQFQTNTHAAADGFTGFSGYS